METDFKSLEQKSLELISRIVRMVQHLPDDTTAKLMGKAIISTSTEAGIHLRDAARAKNNHDYVRDMQIMEAQLYQTNFWITVIETNNYFAPEKLDSLKEASADLLKTVSANLKNFAKEQEKMTLRKQKAREKLVAKAAK